MYEKQKLKFEPVTYVEKITRGSPPLMQLSKYHLRLNKGKMVKLSVSALRHTSVRRNELIDNRSL